MKERIMQQAERAKERERPQNRSASCSRRKASSPPSKKYEEKHEEGRETDFCCQGQKLVVGLAGVLFDGLGGILIGK